MHPPNPLPLAPRASARRGWRTLVSSATALGLLTPTEAVFTNLILPSLLNNITISVGSTNATTIDTVNFGTIAGNVVGNSAAVAAPGTVAVVVTGRTFFAGSKTVTVNADSSAGMSCQSPSTCASTIIPFSAVSWTVSNSVTPSGSPSVFDIQAGSFNGSASQTIASFPSQKTMSNTLSFNYANSAVYPAGSYRGRVTFTASMP
jgi:hypothetical protein